MTRSKYLTAPVPSPDMPRGIPHIISNEAAERFSFYGMKTILVIFMTQYLMNAAGNRAVMGDVEAQYYFHLFTSAVYFFPVLGALLSDIFLGKYRTIISLSLVYCLGHCALALDQTRLGLVIGLSLIAIGSGGIKPCVSAHVGDQFGATNQNLLEKVFGWFYFAINLGAFASTLMTPYLLKHYSSHIAFGVPGILMFCATIIFWMGRNRFVHIPAGGRDFIQEALSGEGLRALLKLAVIYIFVSVFWALFDQNGSSWVIQATKMDRTLCGIELLPSQIQALNPILILIFIPLFTYVIYPALNRFFPLTALRKISIGLFLTVPAFLIPAWIEVLIADGQTPGILWQAGAYFLLTAAEVFVSITCLEFSYTQAPKKMKSLVMALFLLSVSMGNAFTSGVNYIIRNDDGSSKLTGPDYFLFFAGIMFVAAILFIFIAKRYREVSYIQDEVESLP